MRKPSLSNPRLGRLGKGVARMACMAGPIRWLPLLPLMCFAFAATAQALPSGFVDEPVASGIDRPTAMAFAPDGRLFVAEQGGALRIVKGGILRSTPFVNLQVDSAGERGLLGLAFHPNFASNRFVYVHHTVPGAPAHNRVTRFTAAGDVAAANSAAAILDLDNLSDARNHNGGAIHFGADGKLYVAVGDNANGLNSQSLANRLGKMLRVNPDGSVPTDNPTSFPGIAGQTTGRNRAIWAVGLRNPFTFAFQRHNGAMLINEVGAGTFEEINSGRRGRNYGWPTTEGPTSNPNFTSPIYAYGHSTGTPTGCAITGGAFYNPAQVNFPAAFTGKYFFADYCGDWIYYIDPASPSTATPFHSGLRSPIDLAVGPEGALYYVRRGDGQVRRIRYTGQSAQAIVASTAQLEIAEGDAAAVSVRLAAPPASDVNVSIARYLSDASIQASRTSMTFTPGNWNAPQRLTVSVAQDGDDVDDGARFRLYSPGVTSALVWVTAVDDDRPAGAPRAVISLPRTAATVAGANAEFFGDGLSERTLTRAEFSVDGILRYTDSNSSGHYHFGGDHNRFNTTILSDGVHRILMRVFDNQGRSGAHSIQVLVNN